MYTLHFSPAALKFKSSILAVLVEEKTPLICHKLNFEDGPSASVNENQIILLAKPTHALPLYAARKFAITAHDITTSGETVSLKVK